MTEPTATYIQDLRDIRSTGANVKETSFYPALSNLLNEVGKTLKPKVRCVINLAHRGAGLPDGGLFTPDQFQRASEADPLPGQLPARGAIEIKGTGDDVREIAASRQVIRYLQKYRQVLVTNYRDFVLLGRDADGQPARLEEYRLAASEKAFWEAAKHPRKLAEDHGGRFAEYLSRVMLHAAPIAAPKDVAWFLASYARDAKARIETRARASGGELPALANVREALEQALGIKFEGEKGEHFFRSTLVQTLFYGVFSAWVLWAKKHPPNDRAARFNWHEAAWSLHVPMIRALFEQVATPSRLGPLGLTEVLDWTGGVLNRVERATFFERFSEEHAVQYFYEPFLEAFDPDLRKELGVWYTPTEVVKYMVARVDTVLREELKIADGLADPRVYVLDPCCGTGAYLVEVVRQIHETMTQDGADALAGDDLKHAAMERVFGFEILPAPFVVAHLQLGLLLQKLGAGLAADRNERIGVYLTNSLTGWEASTGPKQHLMYPELEAERDAADKVKRDTPILVIIGNPPYNGFGGVAVAEERDLSEAYRTTNRAPAPQGRGLNDIYVRFFRMAERRIVEASGEGIVCLISNYSWLDGLSYTGMRERYLEVFDKVQVDCLNGDKFKTGKLTPDGEADPSVFSTEWNREGIQVGTAIALMLRRKAHTHADSIEFRQHWGRKKLSELLGDAAHQGPIVFESVSPSLGLGLVFTPTTLDADYFEWPTLPDLLPVSHPGVFTARDDFAVDIDRERLMARLERYFDPSVSAGEMESICRSSMNGTSRFDPLAVRAYLQGRGIRDDCVVRYSYRPFDIRWLYWEPETKLLDERRPEYSPHVYPGNRWLAAVRQNRKSYDPPMVTGLAASLHLIERGANLFPLFLRSGAEQPSLLEPGSYGASHPNLSDGAFSYLQLLGSESRPEELFYHVISISHSVSYAHDQADALRQDWPRIPLPANKDLLRRSAATGRRVAALLDAEAAVSGVTSNPIRTELKLLSPVSRVGGGSLSADELAVTAGWGFAGKGGATMPAKGRVVQRGYTPDEREAIRLGTEALGLTLDDALRLLGPTTRDIYLNNIAYWRNVPARVWDYTIGGYQVIKKWLSYRERGLLGRALTPAEAREVRDMARRIAALILLQPELDANYAAVKANLYDWNVANDPAE